MIKSEKFTIIEDDYLYQSGVSYGYKRKGKKPWPKLIASYGKHAVIKSPGVYDWVSRGYSGYYPAVWYLVKISLPPTLVTIPIESNGISIKILEIIESKEPGVHWHKCRRELIKKMYEIEDKR
jgi:hypothetical protein